MLVSFFWFPDGEKGPTGESKEEIEGANQKETGLSVHTARVVRVGAASGTPPRIRQFPK